MDLNLCVSPMHPYIVESLQPKPINADIERTGNRTRSTGGNISFPKTRDNRTAHMKGSLEAKDAGEVEKIEEMVIPFSTAQHVPHRRS